jgi:hypothetical protein
MGPAPLAHHSGWQTPPSVVFADRPPRLAAHEGVAPAGDHDMTFPTAGRARAGPQMAVGEVTVDRPRVSRRGRSAWRRQTRGVSDTAADRYGCPH